MKRSTECRRSGCPISFTLDFLGDKWTLLIIRDMVFLGKKYFGEFLESDEKIATNILADRLKRLEEDKIIFKKDNPDNQKKFIYGLTEKGIELVPLLLEMIKWGAKHNPHTAAPKEFVHNLMQFQNPIGVQIQTQLHEKLKRERK